MYVSWVFADKLRMVMSSIMRWRSGEIGLVIGETPVSGLHKTCNPCRQATAYRCPHFDRVDRQAMTITATSDNQILKSNIRNWAIGLQTFATGSLPRSGLVQRKVMQRRRDDDSLFRLDVGRADHLGPFFGVCRDEVRKLSKRSGENRITPVGDARLDRRIGKSGINCLVELVDYLDRGATRRTDPLPTACLVTRHYFSNRRDVRQNIGARCRSHSQREKFACSDVLDRCSQSIKHDRHLPGEKVDKRRPAASVRYMLHVHASHGLEQLAVDMLRASGTTGRHVDLAGIRRGVRDELGKRLSRERRMHDQDADPSMSARDRRDIAQDIEIELIVERDVPTISRSKLQEGVAIRGRSHDCLGSNIAARTRPVFDDELLTKVLRQPLTEKTCKQVRHAPRRKSNDQADRSRRIAQAKREIAGSAAAPAVRCRK